VRLERVHHQRSTVIARPSKRVINVVDDKHAAF
jgi:hypothetical protein